MPYSSRINEQYLRDYIHKNFKSNCKILDIGPGAGANFNMLCDTYKDIDCVEIFEPYVKRFNLGQKYKNVFVQDVMDFDKLQDYDLIIMGDVLEHLSIENSTKLLERVAATKAKIIVQVPFKLPQGESEGNVHEIHIQDDLTEELMLQRYGKYLKHLVTQSIIGLYVSV